MVSPDFDPGFYSNCQHDFDYFGCGFHPKLCFGFVGKPSTVGPVFGAHLVEVVEEVWQ